MKSTAKKLYILYNKHKLYVHKNKKSVCTVQKHNFYALCNKQKLYVQYNKQTVYTVQQAQTVCTVH